MWGSTCPPTRSPDSNQIRSRGSGLSSAIQSSVQLFRAQSSNSGLSPAIQGSTQRFRVQSSNLGLSPTFQGSIQEFRAHPGISGFNPATWSSVQHFRAQPSYLRLSPAAQGSIQEFRAQSSISGFKPAFQGSQYPAVPRPPTGILNCQTAKAQNPSSRGPPVLRWEESQLSHFPPWEGRGNPVSLPWLFLHSSVLWKELGLG